MDRGAWWDAVHGVLKSWTRLKQLSARTVEQPSPRPQLPRCRARQPHAARESPTQGAGSQTHRERSVSKKDKRGFPAGSAGEESTCNVGDLGSIPGWGRSPGAGKGHPLQYSGLENTMDCIVHGVAKSRTRLSEKIQLKIKIKKGQQYKPQDFPEKEITNRDQRTPDVMNGSKSSPRGVASRTGHAPHAGFGHRRKEQVHNPDKGKLGPPPPPCGRRATQPTLGSSQCARPLDRSLGWRGPRAWEPEN